MKRLPVNPRYRKEEGYNLFYEYARGFIGLTELRAIVKRNEEKAMPYASQKGGLKTGDLIIGSYTKENKTVSFTTDPMVHGNLPLARQEAARLATIDKSKKFIVVEVKAVASVADVNWE